MYHGPHYPAHIQRERDAQTILDWYDFRWSLSDDAASRRLVDQADRRIADLLAAYRQQHGRDF